MAHIGPKPGSSPARNRFVALHGLLRARICLLQYPPGSVLAEEQLAAEFGVSRTPIRRVLAHLEADGLVETRHGVGTVVTDPDLDTLRQIYQLRMRLAELIGELEPLARLQSDLDRVSVILRGLDDLSRQPAPDAAAFAKLNMAFTDELMAAIGNNALREVSARLYYQTARLVLKRIGQLDLLQEIETFRQEVRDILAAMERGDMRAVGFIRRNHIAMSFDRMSRGEAIGEPAHAA